MYYVFVVASCAVGLLVFLLPNTLGECDKSITFDCPFWFEHFNITEWYAELIATCKQQPSV